MRKKTNMNESNFDVVLTDITNADRISKERTTLNYEMHRLERYVNERLRKIDSTESALREDSISGEDKAMMRSHIENLHLEIEDATDKIQEINRELMEPDHD